MYFKFTHILICWRFLITNKDMEADVFTLDFWRMESDSAASATYQAEMWKRENSRVTVKTNKPVVDKKHLFYIYFIFELE